MHLRANSLSALVATDFDVVIVGAGINGAVSAAALASTGVTVALIDRGDFAGFTSQESSNLAWGGIKYLESFEFPLVRALCKSRNQLMRSFPSSVKEIRFLTSVPDGFRRHPIGLWLGSWLYWLMGNGFTGTPRMLSRRQVEQEEPLIRSESLAGAIEYCDAYLYDNDARFVFNFVRTALNHGCTAANYVTSLGAVRRDGRWIVQARDLIGGRDFEVNGRVLVNATGAYVDEQNAMNGQHTEYRHVFSKGVHLLVDRITPATRVLAFFADDGRLFFAIPMGDKTCLGTTDTRVEQPHTQVSDADRTFVLDNINDRLKLHRPLTKADIIAERCGVRPLAVRGDGADSVDFLQLSRGHAVEVNRPAAHLSIFGGKLTDCINVGEEVRAQVRDLGVAMPHLAAPWYGEPEPSVRAAFMHRSTTIGLDALTAPHCSEPLSQRLWRRYGLSAFEMLDRIQCDPTQAEVIIQGTEFVRCEFELAARSELIVKLEDFLRRRSTIGLTMRRDEIRIAPGLEEACRLLFGSQAQAKIDEYFARND